MRLHARSLEESSLSPEEQRFAPPGQTFVTKGKTYAGYAVSVYQRVTFVLIVDDTDAPAFLPSALFDIVDSSIPADWMVNINLGSGVDMVLGPEHISKDLQSYVSMVEQDASQVERFWKRIEHGEAPDPSS